MLELRHHHGQHAHPAQLEFVLDSLRLSKFPGEFSVARGFRRGMLGCRHRLRQLIDRQHERAGLDKKDHGMDDDAGVISAVRKYGCRIEHVQSEMMDSDHTRGCKDGAPATPAGHDGESSEEQHVHVDLQMRSCRAEHHQANERHGCSGRELACDRRWAIDACDQSDNDDQCASKSSRSSKIGVRGPGREDGHDIEQAQPPKHHRHEGVAQRREVTDRRHSW